MRIKAMCTTTVCALVSGKPYRRGRIASFFYGHVIGRIVLKRLLSNGFCRLSKGHRPVRRRSPIRRVRL